MPNFDRYWKSYKEILNSTLNSEADFSPIVMDRINTVCTECGKGKYIETSIHDDWEGKLHCSRCNHEVFRHEREEKGRETKRKTKKKEMG